jgi:Domain of unknown function (DUF5753)
MRAQLDRLSGVTDLANVTVGIIPLGTEVADMWCDHSFNILDGPDPLVHVETLTTPVSVTDPADIEAYLEAFRRLQAAAVTGDDARRLITEASHTLLARYLAPVVMSLIHPSQRNDTKQSVTGGRCCRGGLTAGRRAARSGSHPRP